MKLTSMLTRVLMALALLGAALSASVALAIPGQPGTLDATWGTSSSIGAGKVATSLTSSRDAARGVAIQLDGKLVLAGDCSNGTTTDICALRYDVDGTLDATFGSGGKVVTSVGSSNDRANALLVQSDGKIVVAGSCFGSKYNFCAIRYNADGSLDGGFGSGGKVVAAFGIVADAAFAIVVQTDGKLVLAGSCGIGANNNFCALRFNANGSLDTSFGNAGKVITPASSVTDSAGALVLQPDGRLVLAGSCSGSSSENICARRYNTDGSLDTTFGTGGTVIVAVSSSNERAYAVALQPDGKLVLAGFCYSGANPAFCAVRLSAIGALDASFGGSGKVITLVGTTTSNANAISLQPDGKIVLVGSCGSSSSQVFCSLRYNTDGSLDSSFGTNGKVMTAVVSGSNLATAVVLQANGKLVLAGICDTTKSDFCALRYDGGPFGYQSCKPDIDGDGSFLATTDVLIYARIALGITGPAVINGISFPANATRNTWPLIRTYLITQCGMSLP